MAWFGYNGNVETRLARKEQIIYLLYIYKMKYFPKISRGKVYLSPIDLEDSETFVKRSNDSRITDWTHWTPRMVSLQSGKSYLEGISKNWEYEFAIVRKSDDKFIWVTWLYHIKHINQTAELWIMIWEIDEHNKWYGTDAVNALLLFTFNTLNLYNISLRVKTFNKKGIWCYKKVWFQEVWKKHHCEYCNGEWYDLILMEILKPDWQEKNK